MRTVTSLALALIAGLLAALALAGARADALVHTPGPLQRIAGPMAQDPRLRQALPEQVAGLVDQNLPERTPALLEEGVQRLAQGATQGLVTDERFPEAWAQSLERTRVDWVDRLEGIAAEPGTPVRPEQSTVHLHLAPVAAVGVDRLAEAVGTLPGGEEVERLVRDRADEVLAEDGRPDGASGPGAAPLVVDLGVPDPSRISGVRLAQAVALLPAWPWLAVGAGLAGLLALWTAPARRRWTVLVAAGAAAVLAGAAGRWWLGPWGLGRWEAAGESSLARAAVASLADGVRAYAVPDTVALMLGGGIAVVLGLAGGLLARSRAQRRG